MSLLRPVRRLDPLLLLSLLVSGGAAYPLLVNPGLPVTSDGLLQPYRLVELDAALRGGMLYPRWAPDLWLGHGYPLFNFYAPLAYYLGEAFHWLGLDFELSIKSIVLLAIALGAVSAYLLGRELFGPWGGLVTSAAYVYMPHILTEVYTRGDYPQLLALATLPLVLWCSLRLARQGGPLWLAASALAVGALLLTHSVTAMIFAPAYALWLLVLLFLAREGVWTRLIRLAAANLLGLGLSAFFWLPAIGERPLVQTERLLTGHFDFRLHFQRLSWLLEGPPLPDPRLANGPIGFVLGQPQVGLALLGIAGLLLALAATIRRGSPPPHGPVGSLPFLGWAAGTAALGTVMILPASVSIWEGSDLLALTQFPWRWLGIAGLGLAVLAGASVRLMPQRWPAYAVPGLAGAAVLAVMVSAAPQLYPVLPFDRYPNLTVADVIRFELERGPMGTSSGSEFLPRTVKSPPGRSPMVEEYLAGKPPTKVDLNALPKGVQARVVRHGPAEDEVEVEAQQGFGMLFRTLAFAGWRAYLDGQPIEIMPYETYGFIHLSIPPGRHRVLVRFESTTLRDIGQGLSGTSLLGLVGVLLFSWLRQRRGRAGQAPPLQQDFVGRGLVPRPESGSPQHRALVESAPGTCCPQHGVRAAAALGLLFLALLAGKAAYVDPYTAWFRQSIAMEQPVEGPVRLSEQVELVGYDLQPAQPAPGGTWDITLYWQGVAPMSANYKPFTHLLTPDETALVAQKDNDHPGLLPTSWWRGDKIVGDQHPLKIPAVLPPGRYPLAVGMYDPSSGQRLMPPDGQRSYVIIAWLEIE